MGGWMKWLAPIGLVVTVAWMVVVIWNRTTVEELLWAGLAVACVPAVACVFWLVDRRRVR